MLAIITRTALFLAVFTIMSALVPDAFISQIDGAIRYFAGFIYTLDPFFDVSVFFSCVNVLTSYLLGIAVFVILVWFIRVSGGTK